MYSIGKQYKFELKGKIFYTGCVEAEDSVAIKVMTIRGEEITLNKESIFQAKRIEDSEEYGITTKKI